MGRAGKALRQTLETYKISQNKLAVALNVDRAVVNRWFHEQVDPNAETVAEIVKALLKLNPTSAEAFVKLYLGDLIQKNESEDS
jgi:transcriptional regulator with XRE-family HTH domain